MSNIDSTRRSETDPTISYSRRSGDYIYDINCYETTMLAKGDRFVAFAVNMVRIELVSGYQSLLDCKGSTGRREPKQLPR